MTTMRNIRILAAVLCVAALSACSNMTARERSTAVGAALGGAAGAALTGTPMGTAAGAAIGGTIGHEMTPRK